MTDPYRHLAKVASLPVDADELELNRAGAMEFVFLRGSTKLGDKKLWDTACPVCDTVRNNGLVHGLQHDGPVCTGKRRWWWPWSWACPLRMPHFHMRCATCKAHLLMKPRPKKGP